MSTIPKTALLTNFVPPYWVPSFAQLRKELDGLEILVSTPMGANRNWVPKWGDLPVTVQRSFSYSANWRHEQGFSEKAQVHFPYDTLARLIRDRPDVVISGELGLRTAQATVYRKIFPASRLVIWTTLSEHTETGRSALRTLCRKALLAAADAVLANGASGSRYLRGLGVSVESIFRLPYCADISPHLNIPLKREQSESRRMLCVGQLIERKGLLRFLDALSTWCNSHGDAEYELWFAGDGPLRNKLERALTPPNLRLRLLGSIAYEQLPEVYAHCGVLAFPTLADEWGVVVNEALASGIPVLGSLFSQAVEELITDGVTGWTFRPDDKPAMLGAIDRALSTPSSRLEEMRLACRTRVMDLSPEFAATCFLRAIGHARTVRSGQRVR